MMKNFYTVKNNNGVTLTELMVVSVIFLLVLTVGFSIYFFSLMSFEKGSNQSVLQQDIRISGDIISREIRTAIDLEIIDASNIDNNIDDEYEYIYLDEYSNIIKRNKNETLHLSKISSNEISLNFNKVSEESNLLNFKLFDQGNLFKIESDIAILNIQQGTYPNIRGDEGNAIRFINIPPTLPTIASNPYRVSYGYDLDITFEITLSNDTFINNPTKSDIHLSGSLDGLNKEITEHDNSSIHLNVTGNIPLESVASGFITISKDILTMSTNDLTTEIYVTEATVEQLSINPEFNLVTEGTEIDINTQTQGSNIHYILKKGTHEYDQNDESYVWEPYDSNDKPQIKSIDGENEVTLIAYASKEGYIDSDPSSIVYTILTNEEILDQTLSE